MSLFIASVVWLLIVQGAMMIIMGVYGLYSVLKLKKIGLKVVRLFLLTAKFFPVAKL